MITIDFLQLYYSLDGDLIGMAEALNLEEGNQYTEEDIIEAVAKTYKQGWFLYNDYDKDRLLSLIETVKNKVSEIRAQVDSDNDYITAGSDNCPDTPNPDQADFDGDGDGDVCDTDDDNDGIVDAQDAFPLDPTEWIDTDGDGIGNNADTDDDNDGVEDDEDAFPNDPNEWADSDNDNVGDNSDNCPNTHNPDQADSDGDGVGDACESGLEEGLVAYYPFNGNANDESGNGNNGTVHGATLTTDRFGNLDSAYEFDGVNNYVEVSDSSSIHISNTITVSAWIMPITGCILIKRHVESGFALSYNGTDFAILTGSTSFGGVGVIVDVEPGKWYHLTGTYDNETQRLYWNGVLISSNHKPQELSSNTAPLLIGSYMSHTGLQRDY